MHTRSQTSILQAASGTAAQLASGSRGPYANFDAVRALNQSLVFFGLYDAQGTVAPAFDTFQRINILSRALETCASTNESPACQVGASLGYDRNDARVGW